MRRRQRNNPYKKEMSELAKILQAHESAILDDAYRIPEKPFKMPFPYGKGKQSSFEDRSINFDDPSPRRRPWCLVRG